MASGGRGRLCPCLRAYVQSRRASAIYDDILNGAALRGGTKQARRARGQGARRRPSSSRSRPGALLPRPPPRPFAAPSRAIWWRSTATAYGASVESLPRTVLSSSQWENEDKVVLKKNPTTGTPNAIKLDEVRSSCCRTSTKRNIFDNGDIDLYNAGDRRGAADLRGRGQARRLQRRRLPRHQLNRYGQNDPVKAKLLSNPNFMKAISNAFDRQAFVDKVLSGNAIPATVQTPPATPSIPARPGAT